LLWAARQVEAVRAARGGQPRVFYTLPYLASINAMADRLGDGLGDRDLVGVAHSRAALYHLSRSLCDDDVSTAGAAGLAGKAVSRAAATRLFRELVRVGTPYQLLRGALAGPAHSGILVDCANSVFILDELHAYDARRLGFILAMVALWKQLCRGRWRTCWATPWGRARWWSRRWTGRGRCGTGWRSARVT
jgi:CRISPR-associated endonuclease/helicase Cas3